MYKQVHVDFSRAVAGCKNRHFGTLHFSYIEEGCNGNLARPPLLPPLKMPVSA
jgi:hypothetical protein